MSSAQPTAARPHPRRTSPAGLALIRRFEHFSSTPFDHPSGLRAIGFGHVLRPGEQHLTRLTTDLATELLREDLRHIEIYLDATTPVPLAQHAFDALVSLIFDVGILTYERSRLRALIHAGNWPEAGLAFVLWGTAAPRPYRRAAEATFFQRGGLSDD